MKMITNSKISPTDEYPVDYIPLPKPIADGVEHLANISIQTSPSGTVETNRDWQIFVDVYKVWKLSYPDLYKEFLRSVDIYRTEYRRAGNKGMKKDGDAFIQNRLEMPETLHKMINVMFPRVVYDRKFIDRLIKELPEFKISS